MNRFIKWFASFFDESSTNSFSRMITLVIVSFVLGWDCAQVKWTHKTIDGSTLLAQFAAAATFYVARRVAGAYTDTRLGANQPETKQDGAGQTAGQQ